jgi:hypothetical protein
VQSYTYHWEIKDLLTQFLQAFDGAIIKRFDINRNSGSNIGVRYVYSPKQRVLFDLVDKAQHMTLPVVAFNITSISRDNNRVFNKLEGTYNLDIEDSSKNRHTLQPVPINIAVNISILARFQTDMDQIISNFVPYTDPYFIISWSRDGIPDKEIRTEVLWSGTLNMTYPTDLNNNQPARVACDTSFTIKGWLFKADSDVVGRIFKIENNFYATDEVPANDRNAAALAKIKAALSGTNYTETRVVSAVPQPQLISLYLTPVNNSGSVSIFGSSLQYVNAVYLSGSNSSMFTNTITVSTFANVPSLSAQYPTITGVIPATSFVVESDNKITVSYPAPATTGIMNVFLFNEAGYADILP